MVVLGHAYPSIYGMGGAVGVTLFFVLSGFLITRVLLNETSLRRFYTRRAYRLLPALGLFLLVAGIAYGWRVTIPPAFYASNIVQIVSGDLGPLVHTWSLAVEEHFYLVWPIILLSWNSARRPWLLGASVVMLAVWRLIVPDSLWAYQGTTTNAYALGLGCLLVFIAHSWTPSRSVYSLSLIALLLIGLYPVNPNSATEYAEIGRWLSVLGAGIAFIVVWATIREPLKWLSARPLTTAGTVSYAWYLWHAPVLQALNHQARPWIPLGIASTFLMALISWRLVEEPMLRLRDRRELQRTILKVGGSPQSDTGRRRETEARRPIDLEGEELTALVLFKGRNE